MENVPELGKITSAKSISSLLQLNHFPVNRTDSNGSHHLKIIDEFIPSEELKSLENNAFYSSTSSSLSQQGVHDIGAGAFLVSKGNATSWTSENASKRASKGNEMAKEDLKTETRREESFFMANAQVIKGENSAETFYSKASQKEDSSISNIKTGDGLFANSIQLREQGTKVERESQIMESEGAQLTRKATELGTEEGKIKNKLPSQAPSEHALIDKKVSDIKNPGGKGDGKSENQAPPEKVVSPGHGGTSPGHGGTSPGLAKKGGLPPGQAKKDMETPGTINDNGSPPGLAKKGGVPPGQAKKGNAAPPGHGGTPPGQAKKEGSSNRPSLKKENSGTGPREVSPMNKGEYKNLSKKMEELKIQAKEKQETAKAKKVESLNKRKEGQVELMQSREKQLQGNEKLREGKEEQKRSFVELDEGSNAKKKVVNLKGQLKSEGNALFRKNGEARKLLLNTLIQKSHSHKVMTDAETLIKKGKSLIYLGQNEVVASSGNQRHDFWAGNVFADQRKSIKNQGTLLAAPATLTLNEEKLSSKDTHKTNQNLHEKV